MNLKTIRKKNILGHGSPTLGPRAACIPPGCIVRPEITFVNYVHTIKITLATGWTVRRSNPGSCEIFCTRPDRRWGPASLLYSAYRVFPGVKRLRRNVDHPPHTAPRLKKEYHFACTPPLGLRGLF